MLDRELFKQMFSEYCRSEVASGNCNEYDCEWCPVNMAWNRIFIDEDYRTETASTNCDEYDCKSCPVKNMAWKSIFGCNKKVISED